MPTLPCIRGRQSEAIGENISSQLIEQANGLPQILATKPGQKATAPTFFGSLERQAVESLLFTEHRHRMSEVRGKPLIVNALNIEMT